MNARTTAAAMLLAWLGTCLTAVPARGADPQTVPYELGSGALFGWGCFGPCACPQIDVPLSGRFVLVSRPPDPLFSHYDVVDVNWVYHLPEGDVSVTGSGTYKVGGEFAVQHQMTLDLSVGGKPAKHFDSGLVLGGGDFPRIATIVSLHDMQMCLDTVIQVRASPATAGVPPRATTLFSLAPNPFRDLTRVEFQLRSPGPVHAAVYDVAGGSVRTLADGAWFSSGGRPLVWDGRTDAGAVCAPGRYFVRIRADGRSEQHGVVKLE